MNGNECGGGCDMPDACGNDEREAKLLARQDRNDNRTKFQRFIERERVLLIACVVIIFCMNISTGRYILYPFKIFSTWVHEMCHGMAAKLVGGNIAKLEIFQDGSGLAYTSTDGTAWKRGFIASAGYPGTAVTGGILLIFRRTTLGPTIGTISLGVLLLLSCLLYVRNTFGIWMLSSEGIVLVVAGWLLPARFLDHLYAFLSAVCCLNAVESIQDLFGMSEGGYAGGEMRSTDAHTVAEYWFGDYRFWATSWLILAFVMAAIGIFFARDARELSWNQNNNKNDNNNNATYTANIQSSQPNSYIAHPL